MKKSLLALVCFVSTLCQGQNKDFGLGRVTIADLSMKSYENDTAAAAVYLKEMGEAYMVESTPYNLVVFRYYAKIKVFKKGGLTKANVEVPLYNSDDRREVIEKIVARSYNLESSGVTTAAVSGSQIFFERTSENWTLIKFAIPAVREGSVIEISYEVHSPYLYNFHGWKFQDDIPKITSEYTVNIPGKYYYNIALRGYHKLSKNESKIIPNCWRSTGGAMFVCDHREFAMKDIPAFIEEEYTTASRNFISAIRFELSEMLTHNGVVDKFTREWKDAELELKRHFKFGVQLRRHREILDEEISETISMVSDSLGNAKLIYGFVRDWFQWDGNHSIFCENLKKATDERRGNSAAINFALIAALRQRGFLADPVIISTRDNGAPNELFPVLSEFNHVIAHVKIGGKIFLLDATEDFYPFGVLPERCINGKGRVLAEDGSHPVELTATEKAKQVHQLNARIEEDGMIRGTIKTTYTGYEAITFRKNFYSYTSQAEYEQALQSDIHAFRIIKVDIANADVIDQPVSRTLEIEIPVVALDGGNSVLVSPFPFRKWEKNPFRSAKRLLPVDFGMPIEFTTVSEITYPEDYEILAAPEKTGVSMPDGGGRFLANVEDRGRTIIVSSSLTIAKSLYTSSEYHYLKELFNRVIAIQSTDIMFQKK